MSTTWIYHERQQAQLCGQHALNNLLQTQSFTPHALAEIAHQLDQMELNYMSQSNNNGVQSKDYLKRIAEGSGNVDESGNFSIEVLRSALLSKYDLTLANTLQESVRGIEITNFDGFICNRSSHWFAIRKINGRFWNLNSISERPELISHFHLAAQIEALRVEGYSVFCVVEIGALPKECRISEANEHELKGRGIEEFWWKEDDLMQGTGSKGYSNPWSGVGKGMRLDGRIPATEMPETSDSFNIKGLSEEEMVQLAMAASMQAENNHKNVKDQSSEEGSADLSDVKLMAEPLPGTDGAVRIQFRLMPEGKRIERRFLKSDLVKVLELFVRGQSHASGKLTMKAGFPPKDIRPLYDDTIETAKLSGEQVQCIFSEN